MNTANILHGRCAHDCASTWRHEYGQALPGGPFPGTYGEAGDVRECDHGRLWLFDGTNLSLTHDRWTRLTWWTPLLYARAKSRIRRDPEPAA